MYKPNFTITPSIINAISEISEIKGIVEKSRVLPLNEAQLRRQAIIRMTHTSTSIEGNKLAEFQVGKVLSGMSISADSKSILEVKNYQKALQEIEAMVNKNIILGLELILYLHKILTTGLLEEPKVGHFRPDKIYLVDDLGNGKEVLRYQGPEAVKVPFLINELLKWLVQAEKDNLHPILRAAIFHVQFVTIHPFADGNGRMSRLLSTYILYRANWDFKKIIVLEDYYNRDRLAYYNALNYVQGKSYHEGEDITSWLEYFIKGFLVEARKVAEAIALIGFSHKTSEKGPVFLDHDELKLMDFLTSTGRLTSKDALEVLGIAKRTAQLKLKNLVDKGLIKMEGKGPSIYYSLIE